MTDSPKDNIDLGLIARQQRQLVEDMASLGADMRVLTAIISRLDGTLTALLTETRATHSQIGHMKDRLRRAEEESE